MKKQRKIAVICDPGSVMIFKAIGLDVYSAEQAPMIEKRIHKLADDGYAVIYITESLAEQQNENHPAFTQEGPDREDNPNQFVANIRNGTVVGYRYFDLTNAASVTVTVKGMAHGRLIVSTEENGKPVAEIPVSFSTFRKTVPLHTLSGIHALYFRYDGIGRLDLMEIQINSKEN